MILRRLRSFAPVDRSTPSKKPVELWLGPRCVEEAPKKEKTPSPRRTARTFRGGNCWSPIIGAFQPHTTNVNLTGLTTGPLPGIEHEIISTIKTIRN